MYPTRNNREAQWRTCIFVGFAVMATIAIAASVILLLVLPPSSGVATSSSVPIRISPETTKLVGRHIREELGKHPRMGNATVRYIAHMPKDTLAELDAPAQSTSAIESPATCCHFIGDRAHWLERDLPYRVYRAPDLLPHFQAIDPVWTNAAAGISVLGPVLESNLEFTDAERESAFNQRINAVTRAPVVWPDGGVPLAITVLYFNSAAKQHIIHWEIIFNSNIQPDVCDAVADSSCYDTRTIGVHEVGHVYGLDDIYDEQCQTTMLGYLSRGDTRGRSIDDTTKACVQLLYTGLPVAGEENLSSNTTRDHDNIMWHTVALLLLVFCGDL